MRILQLHCEYIGFKPKSKALKTVADLSEVERKGMRLENALVVFSSFESGDDEAVLGEVVKQVKKHFNEVKASVVVCYPYAHLSSNLAPPAQATALLNSFLDKVKEFNPTAQKAPFGYYKEFELKCKGHPLAELSKTIDAKTLATQLPGKVVVAKATAASVFDLKQFTSGEVFDVKKIDLASAEGKKALANTASFVLAYAVNRLYPHSKQGVASANENSFNHDFEVAKAFTPEDLLAVEEEFNKIVGEKKAIELVEVKKKDAGKLLEKQDFKQELISSMPDDAVLSFYECGDYRELCAGPLLSNTSKLSGVKLTKVGGAYWLNDARNKQLQRISGVAYPTSKELATYLDLMAEAEKRDHRRIGRELDLFSVQEEGPGFPFFHPNGMIIRNEIEGFLREELKKRGYLEIKTPIILDESLWRQSGHWDHYKENMYFTQIDGRGFAVKPMNCPGSILVYKTSVHSYRELPLRLAELGLVHRHELSGVLSGLFRVRAFTQDDAHIYVTPEQIKQEILELMSIVDTIYSPFGFEYEIVLSTRPAKSMGSEELWNQAETALKDALATSKKDYKLNPGDGAFYGPKIDFKIKDSLGRMWQCSTIQVDFQMPERFDLTYEASDGKRKRPVIIHRVILGSFERFFGVLIEHYGGNFPTWLAPTQVVLLPITDGQTAYAKEVEKKLFAQGVRVKTDLHNSTIEAKIREAQLKRIPYMLVVGEKEAKSGTVSVRHRTGSVKHGVKTEDFVAQVTKEIREKQ